MGNIIIGIDPGVQNGMAAWCMNTKKLLFVTSKRFIAAQEFLRSFMATGTLHSVVFEDARLRGGPTDAAYGAGAVRTVCGIWAEELERLGVPYKSVSPRQKGKKWDAKEFRQVTGFTGRTNEHGRDAAKLVWMVK